MIIEPTHRRALGAAIMTVINPPTAPVNAKSA